MFLITRLFASLTAPMGRPPALDGQIGQQIERSRERLREGNERMNYRPDVDGLRAVAVLPVLFFHAGFGIFSGGFVGVDIFFVISGYLITGIISRELAAGSFSVWKFYIRRVRRIVPAALVVCAATVPFAWIWMLPQEFEDYSKSLFATALAGANFHFWEQTDYFAGSAEFQPLLHMWSLAVEEQFYFVFPFLLIAFRRRLGLAAGIAALASFICALTIARLDPVANFYLLPGRFWELAAGALVAIAAAHVRHRLLAEAAAAIGLALVLVSIVVLDGNRPYPGWYALPPVVGAVLLLMTDGKTLAGRLLAWRPLVAVGLISYSLYLWHQPLFAFARIRLFGNVSTETYLALIGATFVLAYATWLWIERPFRDRKFIGDRQVVVSAIAGCGTLFAIGLAGDLGNGLARLRAPTERAALIEERVRPNFGLSPRCEGEADPLPDECRTSDEPEILVWGDSFAMRAVPGVVASNPSAKIVQFTKSACGPVLGVAPASRKSPADWPVECLHFIDAMKAYVEKTVSLRYAVLGSPFDQYLEESSQVLIDGEIVRSDPAVIKKHLSDTLNWLRSNGIEPVIFLPPPTDGREIGACLARSEWLGVSARRCSFPAVESLRRQRAAALLDGLGAETLDVADALCSTETCEAFKDGVLIFRDAAHLSYEGSEYLGKAMAFYNRISGH